MGFIAFNKCFLVEFWENNQSDNAKYKILSYYVLYAEKISERGKIMKHQFSRNELAIGQQGLDLLKQQTVVILGVGGVGSFAAEALQNEYWSYYINR